MNVPLEPINAILELIATTLLVTILVHVEVAMKDLDTNAQVS